MFKKNYKVMINAVNRFCEKNKFYKILITKPCDIKEEFSLVFT